MVQKLLDQQVASQVKDVSDEEALQYYNEHGEQFLQDEQIRVHHILVKVLQTADPGKVADMENKARRILQRIKNGEDFEKLARQYSEDPSALKGGDIGFFSRGDMIKNFEPSVLGTAEWKINYYRINRDDQGPTSCAWSPTGGRFHRPSRFGVIFFR